MEKKTDQARQAFRNGDYKKALRIAKTFQLGMTKEECSSLRRAYECMVYPDFYRAIGKDPAEEIERGLRVFEEKLLA